MQPDLSDVRRLEVLDIFIAHTIDLKQSKRISTQNHGGCWFLINCLIWKFVGISSNYFTVHQRGLCCYYESKTNKDIVKEDA